MIDDILRQASQGLMMLSEADYPFASFVWTNAADKPLTQARLLQLTQHPPTSPVATADLADLFRPLVQPQPWHDPEQQAQVQKFQALEQVIRNQLQDVQVYRVGEVEIDVYIVGRVDRDLAGLSTRVVET